LRLKTAVVSALKLIINRLKTLRAAAINHKKQSREPDKAKARIFIKKGEGRSCVSGSKTGQIDKKQCSKLNYKKNEI
jgi:hypothetical protein